MSEFGQHLGKDILKSGWLTVEYAGVNHQVEVAQTVEQLAEAKALDDLAFSGQVGISMVELQEIMANGAVLLMRNTEGNLIGESQVITTPVSEHPILEPDEAYNYGTAILPGLQSHGLAQVLYKAQELVAVEAGKTRSTLTVRLENAQSLRGRFKAGFHIIGYDPDHYGPFEEGGARMIMEKNFYNPNGLVNAFVLSELFNTGEISELSENNTNFQMGKAQSMYSIKIHPGDSIDYRAHSLVSKIMETGNHLGIGLLKPTELRGNASGSSMLIFKQK